jgi:hypothetical protein
MGDTSDFTGSPTSLALAGRDMRVPRFFREKKTRNAEKATATKKAKKIRNKR